MRNEEPDVARVTVRATRAAAVRSDAEPASGAVRQGLGAAATSVFVFGLYMMGQGLMLMLVPGVLLSAVGVPVPTDAWVRVVGWCLVVLAVYYVQCARHRVRAFFRWSAAVRIAQLGFFGSLWATGMIKPVLVGFSLVEAASGLWTFMALRAEPAPIASAPS